MALPWFKVATSIVGHPKLLDLSVRVPGVDPVGLVVRLWAWVAAYYPDGEIPVRMEPALAASVTGNGYGNVTGNEVVTALVDSGLLERTKNMLRVHDWDVEQGAHAKSSERNKAKQQAYRDRNRLRNGNGVTGVTSSEERRGEESRREEDQLICPPAEKPADVPPVRFDLKQVELVPTAPPTAFLLYMQAEFPTANADAALEKAWSESCPAIDLLSEAKKARAWELSNPREAKKQKRAFLRNWFETADKRRPVPGAFSRSSQDSRPSRPGASPSPTAEEWAKQPTGRRMI